MLGFRFLSPVRLPGGCCGAFLFCRFLVSVASIILRVKTGPFENDSRAVAKNSFHFAMSPLWQAAKLLWAHPKRLFPHRLERLEILVAFCAVILIRRHG